MLITKEAHAKTNPSDTPGKKEGMSSVVQGQANFTPVIVGKAMIGNAKGINICPG